MSSKNDLIARGNELAGKYSEVELKSALRDAIAMDDNEERLALQWALKKKTGTKDGYAFTKEQTTGMGKRLAV